MVLEMDTAAAAGYTSGRQIARRVTEEWGARNLYCPACEAASLQQSPVNAPAVDFQCAACAAAYQLKASRQWSEKRVVDAGYVAMMRAIRSDTRPNLLVMQYTEDWRVSNLLLVPSFFFTVSAIQKRNPLGPDARRAGWVGCNILLGAIPPEGKLRVILDGTPIDASIVRAEYARVKPLSELKGSVRGWAADVLRVIHSLGRTQFSIADVYSMESELSAIYPRNRNIRAKMRQQLQVLRDLGFLVFVGGGEYKLNATPNSTSTM